MGGLALTIRVATPADVPAMVPLVNAAFAIETFLEGPRTDEKNLLEMMQKGEFLVVENSSGQTVACVYTELRGDRGYFGMLSVDPAHQGQGLGRSLIEAVEDRCRRQGCKFMDITVLSLRTELPPFYHKFGYVQSGTQEFRHSRPLRNGVECHCIIMSKAL